MAYVSGFNSKVDITVWGGGTVFYAVSAWSWTAQSPLADVGNTEGKRGNPALAAGSPRFSSRLPGQVSGRLTLSTPAFDPTENEFGAPLAMSPGLWYSVTIWQSARGSGVFHQFTSCTPGSVGQNMGSIASGGAGATLEFETDGEFLIGNVA